MKFNIGDKVYYACVAGIWCITQVDHQKRVYSILHTSDHYTVSNIPEIYLTSAESSIDTPNPNIEDMPIGVPFVYKYGGSGGSQVGIILNKDVAIVHTIDMEIFNIVNNDWTNCTLVDWFEEEQVSTTQVCSHGQEGYCRWGCK